MKRILFLPDPQTDYGLDGLLVGLYELSDVDVYEYPEKESLHGKVHCGYDLEGNPGGGMTAPGGYLTSAPLPGPFHSKEEIFDIFPHFDLILMGVRDYSLRAIKELCQARNITLGSLSNLVICEAEDYQQISFDILNTYKPILYAKRELNAAYSLSAFAGHYGTPIIPCPFSAFLRGLPEVDDLDKIWDVFIAVGQTNQARNVLLLALIELVKNGKLDRKTAWIATNDNADIYLQNRDLMSGMLQWGDYIKNQARAKIGLSVPGFGNDTLHHWELTSFATLCMYLHPGIHLPYPFIDRKHCVHLNADLSNLEKEIAYYLQHEDKREAIAKAGKAHCRQYHSTSARASYLLNIAMRVLGGEKVDWEEYGL